jgi:Helicase subunit of the DNA excision repair complex
MGRAARNINGEVVLYADEMTDSMQSAIDETSRRRQIQREYNEEHGFEPKTIDKPVSEMNLPGSQTDASSVGGEDVTTEEEALELIEQLEEQMDQAAANLEFELAADIRDRVSELRREYDADGGDAGIVPEAEEF